MNTMVKKLKKLIFGIYIILLFIAVICGGVIFAVLMAVGPFFTPVEFFAVFGIFSVVIIMCYAFLMIIAMRIYNETFVDWCSRWSILVIVYVVFGLVGIYGGSGLIQETIKFQDWSLDVKRAYTSVHWTVFVGGGVLSWCVCYLWGRLSHNRKCKSGNLTIIGAIFFCEGSLLVGVTAVHWYIVFEDLLTSCVVFGGGLILLTISHLAMFNRRQLSSG